MKKSKKWAIAFWTFFFVDPFLRALIFSVALASMTASAPRSSGAPSIAIIFGVGLFVLNIFFVYKWFVNDAEENEIYPSGGLKACVVFLAIVGIPYYLFKYKGLKEGSKTLAIIIALFACGTGFHSLIGNLL